MGAESRRFKSCRPDGRTVTPRRGTQFGCTSRPLTARAPRVRNAAGHAGGSGDYAKWDPHPCASSSAAEHLVYIQLAGGSSPSRRTIRSCSPRSRRARRGSARRRSSRSWSGVIHRSARRGGRVARQRVANPSGRESCAGSIPVLSAMPLWWNGRHASLKSWCPGRGVRGRNPVGAQRLRGAGSHATAG